MASARTPTRSGAHRLGRRRRLDRDLRELRMPVYKRKPTSAQSPVPDRRPTTRRSPATKPEKSLTKPEASTWWRRNSASRMTSRPARRWSQAQVPRRRLPSRTRTACRPRSRRTSTTRTATRRIAAAHYHRRREALHHRPGRVCSVGDMLAEQPGFGDQLAALPLRYIPVGTELHNVELESPAPAVKARPRKRVATHPAHVAKEATHCHPAPAPVHRDAARRSTAGPRSVRSATPRHH